MDMVVIVALTPRHAKAEQFLAGIAFRHNGMEDISSKVWT